MKKLVKVWHSWGNIKRHSEITFCQTIDSSDFKLELFKLYNVLLTGSKF